MHKHHIIPLHVGGTNDPSNLVLLTVEQHAEAHRVLWEQYGRKGDKLAWISLSGQIDKEEIQRERSRLGALKLKGRKRPPEIVAKIKRILTGKKRTPESIERIRQSQLGNTNCKGRILSEDTKEKMRNSKLGTTQTKETNKKISHSLIGNTHTKGKPVGAENWIITHPNGTKEHIINLTAWCRNRNLHASNMVAVSKGRLKHYKQYTCKKVRVS